MWDDIADNLSGHVYVETDGLIARLFDAKPWSSAAAEAADGLASKHILSRRASRSTFEAWLTCLQDDVNLDHDFDGTERRAVWVSNQIAVPSKPPSDLFALIWCHEIEDPFHWSHVLAIGDVSNDESYEVGFFRLCEHARLVFAHQPARLFLHGFHIHQDRVTIWAFDRAGIYGSETFDVYPSSSRFVRIIIAYLCMDDDSLGCSPWMKIEGDTHFIEHCGGDLVGTSSLCLGSPPVFARVYPTILGDGLTCYQAEAHGADRWQYAVKLKWSALGSKLESDMLALANERRVWGVPRLVWHETLGTSNDWRSGLRFGAPRMLRRQKDTEQQEEIKSASDLPLEETPQDQQSAPKNLLLNCTVVEPLGDSLHRFKSVRQLLPAIRDAIKAHQSLYRDGGILHQDVGPGNILIPTTSTDLDSDHMAPKGFLIDFDTAKLVSEPGKQFEGIGTPPFRAIGVCRAYLPNNPHTYRHDLESFFYTFLFLAICDRPVPKGRNQLQLPEGSALQAWYEGRPVDEANRKTQDMHPSNFENIITEFKPDFKHLGPLARELREILFPMRDGELWIGTDMSDEATDALYGSMIAAFDLAARSESKPKA